MNVHTLKAIALGSIQIGMMIGFAQPQVKAETLPAPVSNVSVSFDRISFDWVKLGDKIPVSVRRESCYTNSVSSYRLEPAGQTVTASADDLKLLQQVCKDYNPRDFGQLGGYFQNRNNLWDTQYRYLH